MIFDIANNETFNINYAYRNIEFIGYTFSLSLSLYLFSYTLSFT